LRRDVQIRQSLCNSGSWLEGRMSVELLYGRRPYAKPMSKKRFAVLTLLRRLRLDIRISNAESS